MEEGSLFQRMKHLFQGEDEMDEGAQKEAAGLIHNIIRYMDKDAKDIMTHRKHITVIDSGELLEDALKFMLGENYSRFPVCEGEIDSIIGSCIFGRQCRAIWMRSSVRSPFGSLQGT